MRKSKTTIEKIVDKELVAKRRGAPGGGPLRASCRGKCVAERRPGRAGAQGGRGEGAPPVPKMGRCPLSTPSKDVLRLNRRKLHHLIDLSVYNRRHVLRLYTRDAREEQ